jgi:hypothetical protein
VHRDIKPENILFASGHPLVADFGIARAVHTAGGPRLARTGFGLGTPGYMSPEQAAGLRDLDAKTDVFALACVVYEMLIGETPGLWVTEEAARLGRFMDAMPDHRDRLDRLSGSVEQVLVRALALRSADRFESPKAFTEALSAARHRRERYREDDAKRIIGRAAELQADREVEEGALSVGGVERVAAEVGIPPAEVRAAAGELQSATPRAGVPQRSNWSWLSGGTTKLIYDRVISGEVRESEFPYLVEEIRLNLGTVGLVGTLGRSMTWSTSPPGQGTGRNVQITVSARNGETRLHVEEHLANVAGGVYGGIVGGAGGGIGAMWIAFATETLHAPPIAAAGMIVSVAAAYGVARSIFTYTYRKRKNELEVLVDRLDDMIRDSIAASQLRAADLPPRMLNE